MKTGSLVGRFDGFTQLPPRQALSPLLAALYHCDDHVKWHAVSALGRVVAALADREIEAARIMMRRLMWSLNHESGSIGWGAPEAMAEIMALHEGLAEEYAHILVSYMRADGNYLELPALQRGLMWGLGRLAEVRAELLKRWDAPVYLLPYLDSEDPEVRGLAARALGLLKTDEARKRLADLKKDTAEIRIYHEGEFITTSVGTLAAEALASLE